MERIQLFNKDIASIGLHCRTVTQGAEFDLVKDFIEFYCAKFLHDNKINNLAVFIEPHISSGFPDIVFAPYTPAILDNWNPSRKALDTVDLKILSYLLMYTGSSEDIISTLKIPARQVLISLEKLLDANLIVRKSKRWYPRQKNKIYSIRKLISVEAKISNTDKVIEQSFVNTWFASHSYALINTTLPQPATIKKFSDQGIGLYCKSKKFQKIVEAQKLPLPSSYLSLQFNEWIGNFLAI